MRTRALSSNSSRVSAAPQVRQQPAVAEVKTKSSEPPPPPRPALLTKRGADILVRVERLMDDANRALGPVRPTVSTVKDRQAQCARDWRRGCLFARRTCRSAPATDWPAASTGVSFSTPYQPRGLFVRLLFGTLFGLAIAAAVGLGLTYLRACRTARLSAAWRLKAGLPGQRPEPSTPILMPARPSHAPADCRPAWAMACRSASNR